MKANLQEHRTGWKKVDRTSGKAETSQENWLNFINKPFLAHNDSHLLRVAPEKSKPVPRDSLTVQKSRRVPPHCGYAVRITWGSFQTILTLRFTTN